MKLLTTPIPQPRAGAASGAGAGAPSARGTTAANFGALLGKALGGTREPAGSGTADKGSAGQLETSAEQPDSSTGQAGSGSNSSPVSDVVVADFRNRLRGCRRNSGRRRDRRGVRRRPRR